jgi:hypothetical protein
MLQPTGRRPSTAARLTAEVGSFRVDVRVQVAAIKAQVLSKLDDRKAILRAGSDVLVHPGNGDFE